MSESVVSTEPTVDPTPAAPEAEVAPHESAQGRLPSLYRHRLREAWGLGMVIRRLDDRIHFQFQDGRKRTFKESHLHLLEVVDRPYDATVGILDGLRSMFDPDGAAGRTRDDDLRKPVAVDEQVAYFRELFEEGFRGEAYAETHRGDGRARPLKRHRDPAIALAREKLAAKTFEQGPEAVHAAALAVLKKTDLVPAKERARFAEMDVAHLPTVAETLRALLYGQSKLTNRLDAFVRALDAAMGGSPSWELATVFGGLVHPSEHCVVRTKTFQRQAMFMAPGLRCSERPMGLLYQRLQSMVKLTRDRMLEAGLAPRDLLDVRDFMWMTLKPAGRRRVLEMRRARRMQEPAQERETAAA